MARHGENIRKRQDGRWEGRYKTFSLAKGKMVYRSVYGKGYGETKEKLAKAKSGVGQWDSEGKPAWGGESAHDTCCTAGNDGMCRDKEMGENDDAGRDNGIGWNGGSRIDGNGSAVRFSQVAGEWLARIRSRKKYSTYIKYSAVYRLHLAGIVGSCRLCNDTVQELREKISDHLSGDRMSESLQKSIVCVANQILTLANARYSSGVPLLGRPATKAVKKTAGVFTRAEQAKLLGHIYGRRNRYTVAVLLCMHTGLRLGELCSLRWADIDFKGMTLTVGRTVQRIAVPGHRTRTVLLETAPKSGSSRREVPLSSELLGILSQLKGDQPYVFDGDKPMEPRTMQYRFQKILKEAGIDSRNFHTLRHTFATNCAENGMDVKMLCELLGHSDVKITLNLYVHPTMESKRRQMEFLSDFYGQICGQVA